MINNYYIIPIFVPHKGCPHDCIFCNQKKITGNLNDITSEDVDRTIESYLATINKDDSYIEVSFFGGSFTGIPIEYQNELLDAALRAKKNNRINAIRLSTRPDYINFYILNNLKAHGVDVIELGVQSMDQEVLDKAERGHSVSDVINASKLIKEFGFKLGLQMMVGLPGDTITKDLMTAEEIIGLSPDFVRIYPSLVIRDTELEKLFNKGLYRTLNVYEAVNICKELYKKFIINNIPIIRLGLQTTNEISLEGDVTAGPFHPAFRELVESSILKDLITFVIKKYYSGSDFIEIEISPKDISKLFADKKMYFKQTLTIFKDINIKVRQNSALERGVLKFVNGEYKKIMSLYEYIKLEK